MFGEPLGCTLDMKTDQLSQSISTVHKCGIVERIYSVAARSQFLHHSLYRTFGCSETLNDTCHWQKTCAFIALSRKDRSWWNCRRKMATRSEPNSLNSIAELCCFPRPRPTNFLSFIKSVRSFDAVDVTGITQEQFIETVNKTDIG